MSRLLRAACPSSARRLAARLRSSPLGYRLAQGAFWSLTGTAISRGMSLASSIIVARILGRQVFGELGIVQSTVGMLGILAGFGLGVMATKHVAELRARDPARVGRIVALAELFALGTAGTAALVLLLAARWLAATLAAPHLAGILRIGSLLLLLSAANGVQEGALVGFEAFRAIAARTLWAGIGTLPLMVGGAYLAGLEGAVWALVLTSAVSLVLNHLALRSEMRGAGVPWALKGWQREVRVLWDFSLPAFLGSVTFTPVSWICNTILVNQPRGYAEMGVFSAAYAFYSALLVMGSVVGAPLLPMITDGRYRGSERLARANMLLAWFAAVLVALPLLAFPELVQHLYGNDFGVSLKRTLVVVVFYTCIVIYRQGLSRVLTANGLMWWGFASNLLWALVLIPCTLFLVRWGAVGFALSFALAYVVNTIIFLPLYTSRGLVPTGTIISHEAAAIWGIVTLMCVLAFLDSSLALRAVSLTLGGIVVIVSFAHLLLANDRTGTKG